MPGGHGQRRSRETTIGATFQSLLTVGSRIYYETHYAPLLRMQGFGREIAFELRGSDDRVLPVLVNARQIYAPDGTPRLARIARAAARRP